MIGKGWIVNTTHHSSVVSDDFAQFFSYWPHNSHLTMAAMSMERFIQLKQNGLFEIPSHLMTSSSLAGLVAELGAETFKPHKKSEELLGIALALYMTTTNTANMYDVQTPNAPFGFLAVMYPRNKKFTDFAVRPSIYAPLQEVMSVKDTMDFCQQVLNHDRDNGKKEYFKHLKKRS
jgi:hypothetical protein